MKISKNKNFKKSQKIYNKDLAQFDEPRLIPLSICRRK